MKEVLSIDPTKVRHSYSIVIDDSPDSYTTYEVYHIAKSGYKGRFKCVCCAFELVRTPKKIIKK